MKMFSKMSQFLQAQYFTTGISPLMLISSITSRYKVIAFERNLFSIILGNNWMHEKRQMQFCSLLNTNFSFLLYVPNLICSELDQLLVLFKTLKTAKRQTDMCCKTCQQYKGRYVVFRVDGSFCWQWNNASKTLLQTYNSKMGEEKCLL